MDTSVPMQVTPREEPITSRIKDAAHCHLNQLGILHSIMNEIEDGLFGPTPRSASATNEKSERPPGILVEIFNVQDEMSGPFAALEDRLRSLRDRVTS